MDTLHANQAHCVGIRQYGGYVIMAYYFFPGCKVTAQFKDASKTAKKQFL